MSSKCSVASCFKTIAFIGDRKKYPCPFCNNTFYCSIDCRILDWESSHKRTCLNAPITNSFDVSPVNSPLNLSSGSTDLTRQKCLDDYEPVNQKNKPTSELGKGAFGQVKLVRDKSDPTQLYALKIIKKKHLVSSSDKDNLNREIIIQKKLDHPHLIRLYHSFEDKENVYLVLEYAENGNLFFYLHKKKKLPEKEAFVYFFQTCLGLDYLHKKGMIHRDLKPENLLLNHKGNVKLCDFGFSAEDIGTRSTFCGTVDYMAPEMVENKPHDYKVDIWSLGVLLYELTHGYAPFKGLNNNEKFKSIVKNQYNFEGISSEAKDLITQLLKPKPQDRPDFHIIFEHPWLKKFERELNMNLKSFIYKPSLKKGDESPAKKTIDVNIDISKREETSKVQDIQKPLQSTLKIEDFNKVPSSTVFSTIIQETPKEPLKDEFLYKTYTSQPISPSHIEHKTNYKDILKNLDLSYNTSTQANHTTPTHKNYTDISGILNLTPKKQEISSPFSHKQEESSQQPLKTHDLQIDKFASYGLKEDKKEIGTPISPYTSYASTHLLGQIGQTYAFVKTEGEQFKTPEKPTNLTTFASFSSPSYLNYNTADLLSSQNVGQTLPQPTTPGLGIDRAKEEKNNLVIYKPTQYTPSEIKETTPLIGIPTSLKSPSDKSYASDQFSAKSIVAELAKLNNQAEKALAAATKFEEKTYEPIKEKVTAVDYNSKNTIPLSKLVDENQYTKHQTLSKSYTDLDQINNTSDNTERRKTTQIIPTSQNIVDSKAYGAYDLIKDLVISPSSHSKSPGPLSKTVDENIYTKSQALSKSYTDLDKKTATPSFNTEKQTTIQTLSSTHNLTEVKAYGTYEPVKETIAAPHYSSQITTPLTKVVEENKHTKPQDFPKPHIETNQINPNDRTEKQKAVQTFTSTQNIAEVAQKTYINVEEKPSPLPAIDNSQKKSSSDHQVPQQSGGRKNRLLQEVKQINGDREEKGKEIQEYSPQSPSKEHPLYVDINQENLKQIEDPEEFTFAEDISDADIQIKETFGIQQLIEIHQSRALTSQLETHTRKANPSAVIQEAQRILSVEVKRQAVEPTVDQSYKFQMKMEQERENIKKEIVSQTKPIENYRTNVSDKKQPHNQKFDDNHNDLSLQIPNFTKPINSEEKKKVNIVFENTQPSNYEPSEIKQEHQPYKYTNKQPIEIAESQIIGQYSQQAFIPSLQQYTPSSTKNKDLLIQSLFQNENTKSRGTQSNNHNIVDRSTYERENNTMGKGDIKMFSPYQADRETLLQNYRDKLTDYYHLDNMHQNESSFKSRNDQFSNDNFSRENENSRRYPYSHQKSASYQSSPNKPYPDRDNEYHDQRRDHRKNQAVAEMLGDSDEEQSERISRPSLKNARSIPQYQSKAESELGLFAKLSLFCGWHPRKTDQKKPSRKNKARHTGY